MAAEMTVIPRVPIAQVGTWAASTGEWEATRKQFEDAVLASQDPTCPRPRIWIEHDDERIETGNSPKPASGWLSGLDITEDFGGTLVADFNVPKKLADELPFAFPGRSIEGKTNITATSGRRYGLVLDGVALLGKDIPAVTPLPDMAEVLGMVEPRQPVAASGATEPRLIVCALSGAATPASAGPSQPRQEASMPTPAPAEEPKTPAPDPKAEQPSGDNPEPKTEPKADEPNAPTKAEPKSDPDKSSSGLVIPEGFSLVENGTLEEMKKQIAEVPGLVAASRKTEAKEYFDDLVYVKKSVAATSVPELTEMYMKNPDGTRAICDLMPKDVYEPPPVGRVAATRAVDDQVDDGGSGFSTRLLSPEQIADAKARGLIKED